MSLLQTALPLGLNAVVLFLKRVLLPLHPWSLACIISSILNLVIACVQRSCVATVDCLLIRLCVCKSEAGPRRAYTAAIAKLVAHRTQVQFMKSS